MRKRINRQLAMMNQLGWMATLLYLPILGWSQTMPPVVNPMLYDIATAASAQRIAADIEKLVGFGTRHTLSDTLSDTRGIGAARRWIKAEMERTSAACGGCLEVSYHRALAPAEGNGRIQCGGLSDYLDSKAAVRQSGSTAKKQIPHLPKITTFVVAKRQVQHFQRQINGFKSLK